MHELKKVYLQPGLVEEYKSFAHCHGGYSSICNLRPYKGSMQTIGGSEIIPHEDIPGVAKATFSWVNAEGEELIAVATCSNLYVVHSDGNVVDITPDGFCEENQHDKNSEQVYGRGGYGTGGYGKPLTKPPKELFALTWSLHSLEGQLIANPRGRTIYIWSGKGKATPYPNAPEQVDITLVQEEIVMAFGSKRVEGESSKNSPIEWSSSTQKDKWFPAVDANRFQPPFELGRVDSAILFGDESLVWTARGLSRLKRSKQKDEAPFELQHIDNSHVASPNAAFTYASNAYWVDRFFNIKAYKKYGTVTCLKAPFEQDFRNRVCNDQQNKIFCAFNVKFQELWWFYPHVDDCEISGTAECTRYIAYNANSEQWFEGKLPRSSWTTSHNQLESIATEIFEDGNIQKSRLLIQERGASNDGTLVAGSCKSTEIEVGTPGYMHSLSKLNLDIKVHDDTSEESTATFTVFGKSSEYYKELPITSQLKGAIYPRFTTDNKLRFSIDVQGSARIGSQIQLQLRQAGRR